MNKTLIYNTIKTGSITHYPFFDVHQKRIKGIAHAKKVLYFCCCDLETICNNCKLTM